MGGRVIKDKATVKYSTENKLKIKITASKPIVSSLKTLSLKNNKEKEKESK
jgi:hypothetical protein